MHLGRTDYMVVIAARHSCQRSDRLVYCCFCVSVFGGVVQGRVEAKLSCSTS
jgi:hypothetical protein